MSTGRAWRWSSRPTWRGRRTGRSPRRSPESQRAPRRAASQARNDDARTTMTFLRAALPALLVLLHPLARDDAQKELAEARALLDGGDAKAALESARVGLELAP